MPACDVIKEKLSKVHITPYNPPNVAATTFFAKDVFLYEHANDYPPDFGWNKSDAPTFATHVMKKKTAELAFTLETAYFGTKENIFTVEKAIQTGRCFTKALRKYICECNNKSN